MTIIDDAVKDAQLLQEAAIQLAEKRLVNALNPKIKRMVEARLFNEEDLSLDELLADLEDGAEDVDLDEPDDSTDDFGDDYGAEMSGAGGDDQVQVTLPPSSNDAFEDPSPSAKSPSKPSHVSVYADGDVNIELELDDEGEEQDGEVLSGGAVIEAKTAIRRIYKTALTLEKRSKQARNLAESKKIHRNARKLKESVLNYADEPILTGNSATNTMLQEAFTTLTSIQKETEKTMRRYTRFNEGSRSKGKGRMAYEGDYANEMDEMEELDELDAVLNLTPDDDEEAEMLTGLDLDDLDIAVSIDDEGDEGDDMDMDDMDMDDMDMDDAEMDDAEMDDDDEVVEIEESMLRRALAEMRRSRRSPRGRRLSEDAVDAASSFGDGTAGDEMFIDVDEDTLLNVLADELGRVSSVGTAAPAVVEARRRRSRSSMVETRRRAARSSASNRQLTEAARQNRKLKRQLQEMNLFSAKLLYVNKIFNGTNVTAKQRRAIVEAMDNAKTLREAKLLYKSLTQSIRSTPQGTAGKRLSESRVRVLGSSSRSTPSAQPAGNGVEVDRWATLAGIDK